MGPPPSHAPAPQKAPRGRRTRSPLAPRCRPQSPACPPRPPSSHTRALAAPSASHAHAPPHTHISRSRHCCHVLSASACWHHEHTPSQPLPHALRPHPPPSHTLRPHPASLSPHAQAPAYPVCLGQIPFACTRFSTCSPVLTIIQSYTATVVERCCSSEMNNVLLAAKLY